MGDIYLATGFRAVVRAARSGAYADYLAVELTAYIVLGHESAWLGRNAS